MIVCPWIGVGLPQICGVFEWPPPQGAYRGETAGAAVDQSSAALSPVPPVSLLPTPAAAAAPVSYLSPLWPLPCPRAEA